MPSACETSWPLEVTRPASCPSSSFSVSDGVARIFESSVPRPSDDFATSPVLVVFQGADAYVTPSWYETKRETGKVVPTWNYAVVQVRGTARVIDDADWLLAQITALTMQHETPREKPWAVSDAPDAYVKAQMKGIVGVEIEITAIEGKWKVSQNRPIADREGVAAGLGETAGQDEMTDLVRRYGGLPEAGNS